MRFIDTIIPELINVKEHLSYRRRRSVRLQKVLLSTYIQSINK